MKFPVSLTVERTEVCSRDSTIAAYVTLATPSGKRFTLSCPPSLIDDLGTAPKAPPPPPDEREILGTLEYAHHDPGPGLAGVLHLFVRVEGEATARQYSLSGSPADLPPGFAVGQRVGVRLRQTDACSKPRVVCMWPEPSAATLAREVADLATRWAGLPREDERSRVAMRLNDIASALRLLHAKSVAPKAE